MVSKIVYAYDKCSTCRNAIKWFGAQGQTIEVRPIVEQPPEESELRELIRKSGQPLNKFFNTSGEVYREMNLKSKLPGMDENEQIRLLASNGKLLKRPIVSDGERVTVGFKEENFNRVWGGMNE